MSIIAEKIRQAGEILEELDIDLWVVFVRETRMHSDPVLPLVVGADVVWQSFFFYSPNGEVIALVGDLDEDNFKSSGLFTEVRTYTRGVRDDLIGVLDRLDPRTIAVNYSHDDIAADGLTHGMYLLLRKYLRGTPYVKRLISSEHLVGKLRGRKLPAEIERVSAAAGLATEVWDAVVSKITTGMSEVEIAAAIDQQITSRGRANAFATIVNAGDKTRPGHGLPTEARLSPGDLLHVDFGVMLADYCSDMQRLIYYLRPGETSPPAELTDAFELVNEIITESAARCRPGVKGWEVDRLARKMLRDHSYPEYQHALGHQLGRSVHDGAAIIGPRWARYGKTPAIPLEAGNVFTLELDIMLPGIGCVGLEEDICITDAGGRFLTARQEELTVR